MSELETIRLSRLEKYQESKPQDGVAPMPQTFSPTDFDGEALLTMARLQKTLKNFSESAQYFEFAFDIDRQISTLMEWAGVLLDQGLVAEALALYYRALNEMNIQDHERFLLYKDIGNIYLRAQDFESAEENYHRAFAIRPDSDALLVNMGTLELQRGNLESAKVRFRESLAKNRQNENAWLGLALVHRQFGDVELAWANLLESLDINAANTTGLQLLIDWAYRDGKLSNAINLLSELHLQKRLNETWLLVLAQLLFDLGNTDEAARHVENILNLQPNIPGGTELLAQIERRRHDQRITLAHQES